MTARATLPGPVDRRLPAAARRAVDDAWERLADRLEGRVLDLHDRTTGDLARHDRDGDRFDAVVSVCRLAAEDDPIPLLTLVLRLLGDDGHLVFVEPSRPVGGARGASARLAGPAVAAGAGWRTDRSMPPLLRSAGFVLCDLRRTDLPAPAWPVRLLVEGTAIAAAPDTPVPDDGGP